MATWTLSQCDAFGRCLATDRFESSVEIAEERMRAMCGRVPAAKLYEVTPDGERLRMSMGIQNPAAER